MALSWQQAVGFKGEHPIPVVGNIQELPVTPHSHCAIHWLVSYLYGNVGLRTEAEQMKMIKNLNFHRGAAVSPLKILEERSFNLNHFYTNDETNYKTGEQISLFHLSAASVQIKSTRFMSCLI